MTALTGRNEGTEVRKKGKVERETNFVFPVALPHPRLIGDAATNQARHTRLVLAGLRKVG